MKFYIEVFGKLIPYPTNNSLPIKFIIKEETYYIWQSGLIECDSNKCGEWHQGGHNLYDLLERAIEND